MVLLSSLQPLEESKEREIQYRQLEKKQICLSKSTNTTLCKGMRPFVKRSDSPWKQEGTNVALTEERFCYQRQNFSFEKEDKGDKEENTFFRKFSF